MDLTANSIEILENRYLLKNKVFETPDQLLRRVAKHIASAEVTDRKMWEENFYEIMRDLAFLPNSPTLMNAALSNGQLSACFVLPVKDSLQDIFTTLKDAALIHQSGGGTGFNFSKLRPKDDLATLSRGTSSGPISFIKIFDTATELIKQGGKRRGANMGILNVDHPDIEAFITIKLDGKSLRNFNLSVGISDAFMDSVSRNVDWHLVNPRTKKIQQTLKARKIWDNIVAGAWQTGDPGLIFLDTVNKANPLPKLGAIQSTNPCGEVPLLDYESCNLGSLNLTKVLIQENHQTTIDWDRLEANIHMGIRFLDNVITVNHYLLPEIQDMVLGNRKIGLGIMGWAEMLILLGIPYASEEAVRLAEKLMHFIQIKSYKASETLAKARGTFPRWQESKYAPYIPMRNATCNSIAPTGSISVIANTSYSIEPLYALAYKRVGILENSTQTELNGIFVEKMKTLGLWTADVESTVRQTGSIPQIEAIPKEVKKLFETSLDIPWKYHLLHQRAFQNHTDNAVSKTINLPEDVSVQEVSEIYMTAWEYQLKGITIYRNRSKTNQVLQHCNLSTSGDC